MQHARASGKRLGRPAPAGFEPKEIRELRRGRRQGRHFVIWLNNSGCQSTMRMDSANVNSGGLVANESCER